VRPELYFDGEPDLFRRTKALFAEASRLHVRYPTPNDRHHALRTDAKGNVILSAWRAFFRRAA
jgi:hypothetical protein